jgi:hypothetical protein
MTANLSTDYSVYVTIMNRVTNILSFVRKDSTHGNYSPITLPQNILENREIYFTLQGGLLTGSEGSVTYEVDGKGQEIITLGFKCPQVSDNDLSIISNQTPFHITFYGETQPIQWNPDGTNWGTPDSFPKRGHPLYALFVIKPSV